MSNTINALFPIPNELTNVEGRSHGAKLLPIVQALDPTQQFKSTAIRNVRLKGADIVGKSVGIVTFLTYKGNDPEGANGVVVDAQRLDILRSNIELYDTNGYVVFTFTDAFEPGQTHIRYAVLFPTLLVSNFFAHGAETLRHFKLVASSVEIVTNAYSNNVHYKTFHLDTLFDYATTQGYNVDAAKEAWDAFMEGDYASPKVGVAPQPPVNTPPTQPTPQVAPLDTDYARHLQAAQTALLDEIDEVVSTVVGVTTEGDNDDDTVEEAVPTRRNGTTRRQSTRRSRSTRTSSTTRRQRSSSNRDSGDTPAVAVNGSLYDDKLGFYVNSNGFRDSHVDHTKGDWAQEDW